MGEALPPQEQAGILGPPSNFFATSETNEIITHASVLPKVFDRRNGGGEIDHHAA
jgi:hypothetical protein